MAERYDETQTWCPAVNQQHPLPASAAQPGMLSYKHTDRRAVDPVFYITKSQAEAAAVAVSSLEGEFVCIPIPVVLSKLKTASTDAAAVA